ncbi:XRE family transcriptional regulator [Microcystis phage Mae-JY02]
MQADIPIGNIPVKYSYSPRVFDPHRNRMQSGGMNNVANIRNTRNLNQSQLAELAGVAQPHISRLENDNEGVTLGVIFRVAEALNVPVWELFAEPRTATERLLLDVFRKLPPDRQAGWIDLAQAVLDQPEPGPRKP